MLFHFYIHVLMAAFECCRDVLTCLAHVRDLKKPWYVQFSHAMPFVALFISFYLLNKATMYTCIPAYACVLMPLHHL